MIPMVVQDSVAIALDALEDFIGGFGPFKGLGILVADLDEFPDRLFQGDGAAVGAPLDGASGQQGEPSLHLIEP